MKIIKDIKNDSRWRISSKLFEEKSYTSLKVNENENIMAVAIKIHPSCLAEASGTLKSKPEYIVRIIKEADRSYKLILKREDNPVLHADDTYQSDIEVILKLMDQSLKDNEDVMAVAVQRYPHQPVLEIIKFSTKLSNNPDFIIRVIKEATAVNAGAIARSIMDPSLAENKAIMDAINERKIDVNNKYNAMFNSFY